MRVKTLTYLKQLSKIDLINQYRDFELEINELNNKMNTLNNAYMRLTNLHKTRIEEIEN